MAAKPETELVVQAGASLRVEEGTFPSTMLAPATRAESTGQVIDVRDGTGAPRRLPRVLAIDAFRFLALLGIMWNHVNADQPSTLAMWDFHAVGFTVLIGMGSVYSQAAGKGLTARQIMWQTWARAGALIIVGLILHDVQQGVVSVVLVHLGLLTAFSIVVARLRDRWVWLTMAASLIGAPLIMFAVARTTGWVAQDLGLASFFDPIGAFLFVTTASYYPVSLWLAAVCAGCLAARHLKMRSRRSLSIGVGAGLAIAGAAALISWVALGLLGQPRGYTGFTRAGGYFPRGTTDARWLWGHGAYFPTAPSMIFSVGVVIALVSLVGLLCTLPRFGQSWAVRWSATVGAMTLSAYTLHVLVYSALAWSKEHHLIPDGLYGKVVWGHLALTVLGLLLWAHLGRAGQRPRLGPLEWLTRWWAALCTRPGGLLATAKHHPSDPQE